MGDGALISCLRNVLNEYEQSNCLNQPVCPQMTIPYATVCMVSPPPILAPTEPQPVKPLQLPSPPCPPKMSQAEAEKTRYANFYNNYNIDWHPGGSSGEIVDTRPGKCAKGVTIDGQPPCPPNCKPKPKPSLNKGCPTGFQPCSMKLTPPANCHPCGIWSAEIQPCPPKPKKGC